MEVAKEVLVSPRRLYTSNRVLDDLLGGLEPAKLTFLNSGSRFVHNMVFLLGVRHILDFDRDVVYVDGGNSINPYSIAAIAKRYGKRRQDVLGRIRVARAFTAYQMTTILLESLEDEVRAGPGLLILSCLPDLFLDEDVEYQEAYHLLRRGLKKVRQCVKEEEIFGVVTNHGLSQLAKRRGIGHLLHQMSDQMIKISPIKGGLLISLPKEGRSTTFTPIPPTQSILEDYVPEKFPHGQVTTRISEESRRTKLRGRQIEISTFIDLPGSP